MAKTAEEKAEAARLRELENIKDRIEDKQNEIVSCESEINACDTCCTLLETMLYNGGKYTTEENMAMKTTLFLLTTKWRKATRNLQEVMAKKLDLEKQYAEKSNL